LNLAEIRRDVVWYVRSLEEAMIRATADFGIAAKRVAGCTGVWIEIARTKGAKEGKEVEEVKDQEKLGAIGVHIGRWVTSHGFAYNVSTDLHYFDLIVPCGIAGKRATSLEARMGQRVRMEEASSKIVARFGEVFGLSPRAASRELLESMFGEPHPQPAATSV
jgi:lipoyl(octanoyl) transferase